MKWTFFVLDLDNTYGNESENALGVQPFVYLIPEDRQEDIKYCARGAADDFHSVENEESGKCIGDYFDERLEKEGISVKPVGSVDLTFGERQENYLSDCIPWEVL